MKKPGHELMNSERISIEDLMEVAAMVYSPKLNMCRRDYDKNMASDFNWIFGLNPIGGSTFVHREIMRLAVVGKAFEDATGTEHR